MAGLMRGGGERGLTSPGCSPNLVNMIVTPFGREIKRLRAERGITIRDLAAVVGKSIAYLAKIEAQGEVPAPVLICEMATALGADKEELLHLAKQTRLSMLERDIDREYALAAADVRESGSRTATRGKVKGRQRMATVLSLVNMKGGVGKTTLAMQLAHAADSRNLKTLAVDLDPQSNLSQALMGPKRYVDHLKANKPTVVEIFEKYLPGEFDVGDVVLKKAGYWSDTTLDLIPSRLELSRTLKNAYGKERQLALALADASENYDLVIIDCAPTESVLTDAAYFASGFIIVPIKPEFLATIGLPLLARSIKEFKSKNSAQSIKIAGLVFNHSSSYSSGPEGQQSIKEVSKEAKQHGWHICENQVRYSASYAKAAREQTPLSKTSYTRGDVVREFRALADEVFGLVGLTAVTS